LKAALERIIAAIWPHEFDDMTVGIDVTYEMRCNWKVFFENAIDRYHSRTPDAQA